jgi:two-component system, NtrC family, response regulator AtoC
MSYSVLIIEDEPILARNITLYLERGGLNAQACDSAEAGLAAFDEWHPDVVVLDHNLPGRSGLEVLRTLRQRDHQVPIVMTTGHGSEQVAVDAMKAGAFDYLIKPVSLAQLRQVLDRAVQQQRQQEELRHLRQRSVPASAGQPAGAAKGAAAGGAGSGGALAALWGRSRAMDTLRDRLRQILDADLRMTEGAPPAVLIHGETGTGKELVARALHFDGPRREGPFVELNCASLPATLVESELFGHERGAFTDAKERRIGLIEAAHGGTLFLDEVAELEPATQAKLLKLLEDRHIRRLGSVREQAVDVRVLAASHRSLDELVAAGSFRADLYYRLGIVRVSLPPLREREGDVPLLARHFLARLAQRYGKPGLQFTPGALQRLSGQRWPGNVRELSNLVEQCVILATGDTLDAEALPLSRSPVLDPTPRLLTGDEPARSLPELERQALQEALTRHDWNVSKAARALGISRDTLRYRIEKHGLSP